MKLLHQYIEDAAKSSPGKVAVIDHGKKITYQQLDEETNQIARFLRQHNYAPNTRIGICFDNSINAIVAIVAILKADCCYVPLDTSSPVGRASKQMDECDAAAVIVDDNYSKYIGQVQKETKAKFRIIDLSESADIKSMPKQGLVSKNALTDLAYVLFTSGSTGQPKGVMLSHLNVLTFIHWAKKCFKITQDDVIANSTPYFFDLSVLDLFASFLCGSTICIVNKDDILFPKNFIKVFDENRVTFWLSVPSILVYLLQVKTFDLSPLRSLRTLLWCGEVFPTKYAIQLMTRFPDKLFANLYGPTETTVASTYYILKEIPKNADEPIPIGFPLEGTKILIVDESNREVKKKEKGELCILGASVSSGYINNPEKTQERFVKNPKNGEMMYKTGDIAWQDETGLLHFVGRKDHQIKYMGHRIEIGEIESAFYSLPYIKECCVVDILEDERVDLVSYIVLNSPREINLIKEDLLKFIPKYMIPKNMLSLSELPKTSNGKIDRVKLKSSPISTGKK